MGRGGCTCCGDFVTTAKINRSNGDLIWKYNYGLDTSVIGVLEKEILIFPTGIQGQMWKTSLNNGEEFVQTEGNWVYHPYAKVITKSGQLLSQDIELVQTFGTYGYYDPYWNYNWYGGSMSVNINSSFSGMLIDNFINRIYAAPNERLSKISHLYANQKDFDNSLTDEPHVAYEANWDLFPSYMMPFGSAFGWNANWYYYYGGYYNYYWWQDRNNNVLKQTSKNLTKVNDDTILMSKVSSYMNNLRINLVSIDDTNVNFCVTYDVDSEDLMSRIANNTIRDPDNDFVDLNWVESYILVRLDEGNGVNIVGNQMQTSDEFEPSTTFSLDRGLFHTYFEDWFRVSGWDKIFEKVSIDIRLHYHIEGEVFNRALNQEIIVMGNVYSTYVYWSSYYSNETLISYDNLNPFYDNLGNRIANGTIPGFNYPAVYICAIDAPDGVVDEFIDIQGSIYNSNIPQDIINEGDSFTLPVVTFTTDTVTSRDAAFAWAADQYATLDPVEAVYYGLGRGCVNHAISNIDGIKALVTVSVIGYIWRYNQDVQFSQSGGGVDSDGNTIPTTYSASVTFTPYLTQAADTRVNHYLLQMNWSGVIRSYFKITGELVDFLDLGSTNAVNYLYRAVTPLNRYSPFYSIDILHDRIYVTLDDNVIANYYALLPAFMSYFSTESALFRTMISPNTGTQVQVYVPYDPSQYDDYFSGHYMDYDVYDNIAFSLEMLHGNVMICNLDGSLIEAHHVPAVTASNNDGTSLIVGSTNSSNRIGVFLAGGLTFVAEADLNQPDANGFLSDAQITENEIMENNPGWMVEPHIYLVGDFHSETLKYKSAQQIQDDGDYGVVLHIGSVQIFIGLTEEASSIQSKLRQAGFTNAAVVGGPIYLLPIDIGGVDYSELDYINGFMVNDALGLFNYSYDYWTDWYAYGYTYYNFYGYYGNYYFYGGYNYGNPYYGYYWGNTWWGGGYWGGWWGIDVQHGNLNQSYYNNLRVLPIPDSQFAVQSTMFQEFLIDNNITNSSEPGVVQAFFDSLGYLQKNYPIIYMYGSFVGSTTLFDENLDDGTADANTTTYEKFISKEMYANSLIFPHTFDLDYLDSIRYRRINDLFSGFMIKVENSTTSIKTKETAALYKFDPDGTLDWHSQYGNQPYIQKDINVEKCPAFQGMISDIQVSSGNIFITGNVINIDTNKPGIYGNWSEYYNAVIVRRISDEMLYQNPANSSSGSMYDCLGYFDDNVKTKGRWFNTSEKIKFRSL